MEIVSLDSRLIKIFEILGNMQKEEIEIMETNYQFQKIYYVNKKEKRIQSQVTSTFFEGLYHPGDELNPHDLGTCCPFLEIIFSLVKIFQSLSYALYTSASNMRCVLSACFLCSWK